MAALRRSVRPAVPPAPVPAVRVAQAGQGAAIKDAPFAGG
jgi:hypothetical protein